MRMSETAQKTFGNYQVTADKDGYIIVQVSTRRKVRSTDSPHARACPSTHMERAKQWLLNEGLISEPVPQAAKAV